MHDRYYIGGGVIAAVLGVSPFQTPLAAYHAIIGDAPEPDADTRRFFERRKQVEPFVFWVLENEKGFRIKQTNVRYIDPDRDYFRAEIDAETACGLNVEIKSVHQQAARKWGRDGDPEAVPVHVAAQALWGMPFTGSRQAMAVGQIGFDDCRLYPIYRSDELIAGMRDKAEQFWHRHILPRVPPEPTTAQDVIDWVPAIAGKVLFADDELGKLVAEARDLTARANAADKEAKAAKEALMLQLQDCTTIVWNGKTVLNWGEENRTALNHGKLKAERPEVWQEFCETSSHRVMRFKK